MSDAKTEYKTWMCLICGYVYDEAAGVPEVKGVWGFVYGGQPGPFTVIAIHQRYAGHSKQALLVAAGARAGASGLAARRARASGGLGQLLHEGLGRRDADRPGERPERYAPARSVHRRREARIIVPVVQSRVRELLGEQPEPGNVSCPAPARRTERQDGDLEGIARLRAVDVDRHERARALVEKPVIDVGGPQAGPTRAEFNALKKQVATLKKDDVATQVKLIESPFFIARTVSRAMIFAPRSWPSRPGFATRTRIFRSSA